MAFSSSFTASGQSGSLLFGSSDDESLFDDGHQLKKSCGDENVTCVGDRSADRRLPVPVLGQYCFVLELG